MTLFNDNPTILEECQLCMHVDHFENIFCDSYIVEFDYDPTCNYYERGRYGCRIFHVTKLPPVMLRSLLFISSSLHMVVFACLDLFSNKIPMHRKHVRLKLVRQMFHDDLFIFQWLSFVWASLQYQCLAKRVLNNSACWEATQFYFCSCFLGPILL